MRRLSRPSRLVALGVLAILAMRASGASAAPGATVLLLRPARPSALAGEAIVRLRGELVAAGFGVELVDVGGNEEVRAAMTPATMPATVDAVIALFGDTPDDPGALLVINRATGKLVRHAILPETDASRAAEILSIRALEILRASLLEAALRGPPPPPSPPPPPPPKTPPVSLERHPSNSAAVAVATRTTAAEPAEPTRSPRLALEVGGLILGSLDGIPPSVLPLLRIEVGAGDLFLGRLTVAGLGTRARVASAGEVADVSQQFALAEAALQFRATRTVRPFVSLGAGATHVSAEGQSSSSYLGRQGGIWAAVADIGAGLRLSLGDRFQLAGEVHAERVAPYPVVRFAGTNLAEEGRPTLLGSLSLVAWM